MVAAKRQAPPDLAVQPAAFPLRHVQVPGERLEELDVLLGRIDPFPAVLTDRGDLEEPAGLDPGPLVGQLTRPRPRRAGRQPFADLVVDVLDLLEERVAAVGKGVLGRPEGEMTAGPQRLPRPLVADGGVDPVPGGGRVHQAERVRRPPLFERGPHHLNLEPGQVLPDHRGQLRAELDAGDPVAAPRQRAGRLAGRAPHLEQVVARRQAGQRDEIVVQRPGILRPDPVVPRGGRVERLP